MERIPFLHGIYISIHIFFTNIRIFIRKLYETSEHQQKVTKYTLRDKRDEDREQETRNEKTQLYRVLRGQQ